MVYTFQQGTQGSGFYFGARVNPVDGRYLDVRLEGDADGWVGVGFSTDQMMVSIYSMTVILIHTNEAFIISLFLLCTMFFFRPVTIFLFCMYFPCLLCREKMMFWLVGVILAIIMK